MPALPVVRWILLALGVLGVLASTVLYHRVYDATIGAMLRLSERMYGNVDALAGPLGVVFKNHRLIRAWNLLYSLLFFAAWWYLGTPAGVAWWSHVATSPGVPR